MIPVVQGAVRNVRLHIMIVSGISHVGSLAIGAMADKIPVATKKVNIFHHTNGKLI